MFPNRTISVTLYIDDQFIKEKVERVLLTKNPELEVDLTGPVDNAQVVIGDFIDSLTSLPLPEQVNKAQGKPLVVITKSNDPSIVRRLFLEGATDVINIDEVDTTLLFAVQNASYSQSAITRTSQFLTSGLVYFRELSELAGTGADLQTFFNRIVEVVAQIMDVEIVSLMLLNDRYQTLWIAAAKGLDEEIVRDASVPMGEGISGRVASQGRPLLIQNVEEEPNVKKKTSSHKYNTKGLLSVPILVRKKVIGVFNVNNKLKGGSFRESDLNILIMLSNQAGLAIDNARMFSDLKSKAQSLEMAYNELKKLNNAKTDLVINLSHEMKTPLTAIIGYVDLMLSGQIDNKKRVTETLEKISQRGRHLNRLVERILTYFALQTKSINWMYEMTPLSKMLYSTVDDLQELANKNNIEIFIDGPSLTYDIYCDISHMREVFSNLIENAIIFNRTGGKVNISGQAVSMGSRLVKINIEDTGPGIPKAIEKTIFDGFVQTDDMMTQKPDGLGIGLAMSLAIIEDHFGSIKLSSNSDKGAVFTITLPLK